MVGTKRNTCRRSRGLSGRRSIQLRSSSKDCACCAGTSCCWLLLQPLKFATPPMDSSGNSSANEYEAIDRKFIHIPLGFCRLVRRNLVQPLGGFGSGEVGCWLAATFGIVLFAKLQALAGQQEVDAAFA